MTDQSVGLPGLPAKGGLRAVAAYFLPHRGIRPATAWLATATLVAGIMLHFWRDEGEYANILFTAAVTAALILALVLISRRAMFATVVGAIIVAAIVAAAAAKRATMNMVVHAYDLFFYLSSWSTVSYLWSDQRRYVLAAVAALLGAVIA